MDFLGVKDLRKSTKATKFFKGHRKKHSSILSKNYIFCLKYVNYLDIKFGQLKEFDPQGHKGQKS